MRLFFSWQSDIPENRKILRKILQKICKEFDIEYTEDTRGETGGDFVVDILQQKIANSHIFVGDITIVGKAVNGDSLINSNVAYELGFAEAKHSRRILLLVMNEEYGTYEDMPFDLGKRIITKFCTSDNKLSDEDHKMVEGEFRRKVLQYVGGSSVNVHQLPLNKSEKTLLYWAARVGDGFVSDAYFKRYPGDHGGYFIIVGEIGPYRRGDLKPLHERIDTKKKARLRNALDKLVEKGLLIKRADQHWLLSEEGEVVASSIAEEEVDPLPSATLAGN